MQGLSLRRVDSAKLERMTQTQHQSYVKRTKWHFEQKIPEYNTIKHITGLEHLKTCYQTGTTEWCLQFSLPLYSLFTYTHYPRIYSTDFHAGRHCCNVFSWFRIQTLQSIFKLLIAAEYFKNFWVLLWKIPVWVERANLFTQPTIAHLQIQKLY